MSKPKYLKPTHVEPLFYMGLVNWDNRPRVFRMKENPDDHKDFLVSLGFYSITEVGYKTLDDALEFLKTYVGYSGRILNEGLDYLVRPGLLKPPARK
jgi:hypothetical protein